MICDGKYILHTEAACINTISTSYIWLSDRWIENKTWKKGGHEVIAGKSAYLLLLNKKTPNIVDYFTLDPNDSLASSSYHYVDCYKPRISSLLIWSIQDLSTPEQRLGKSISVSSSTSSAKKFRSVKPIEQSVQAMWLQELNGNELS